MSHLCPSSDWIVRRVVVGAEATMTIAILYEPNGKQYATERFQTDAEAHAWARSTVDYARSVATQSQLQRRKLLQPWKLTLNP